MKHFLLVASFIFFSSFASAQEADWEELRNYAGVIGSDLKISMTLIMQGQDVHGVYFYNKWLKDIPIKGSLKDNRSVVLKEYDAKGIVTAVFKARFADRAPEYGDSQLKYEVLEGTWSRPDGSESKKFRVLLDNATYRPQGKGRYYVAGFDDDRAVESFAQKFWKAVVSKDREKVAGMVAYPVKVTIAGKDVEIKNKAALIKNYDHIFNKDFYERVKSAVPHNLFAKASGVMLGDKGEIWLGSENDSVKVIAINNGAWK